MPESYLSELKGIANVADIPLIGEIRNPPVQHFLRNSYRVRTSPKKWG